MIPNGFKCRAWVHFNGTGVVAIRGSGNVSSITDNNTGDYTVNFAAGMPDANYAYSIAVNRAGGGAPDGDPNASGVAYSAETILAGSMRIVVGYTASKEDSDSVSFIVHR